MKIDDLKSKILQLAIQGKLVEQDENDTQVEILLQRISESREKLIKEKKIKREKSLPEITAEEKPFEIPKGWKWVRLGQIGFTNIGLTYSPKDVAENGTPVLRSTNIQNNKIDLNDLVYVRSDVPENKMCQIGDILICARNGSKRLVGKCAIIDEEGMSFGAFMAIYRSKYNKYINLLLNSYLFRRQLDDVNTVTINQITQEMLKNTICPLPPLEEQERIVAKVDELFAIIDELAENKEAMLKNIADTRNKVLQLAIQGKLVEQCEGDEPVEIILQRISELREKLIKEKKIKKEKPLPEITEGEKLFDIPKVWKWVRLGEISTIKGGKRVPAGYKLLDTPTEFMYIRVADMKNGTILENDIKYISSDIYDKIKNYYIESDDIYITIAGTIGRVGTVPEKFNGANLTENASKIKCCYVDKEYIFSILNSDFVQKQILDKTKKVGQPKLALNQIESLVLPVPPLEEQERIVEKVEEIMSYLDKLEKTILEEDII